MMRGAPDRVLAGVAIPQFSTTKSICQVFLLLKLTYNSLNSLESAIFFLAQGDDTPMSWPTLTSNIAISISEGSFYPLAYGFGIQESALASDSDCRKQELAILWILCGRPRPIGRRLGDFGFKEQYPIGEAEQWSRRAAEKTVAVPERLEEVRQEDRFEALQ
jgi:hypothetical protein